MFKDDGFVIVILVLLVALSSLILVGYLRLNTTSSQTQPSSNLVVSETPFVTKEPTESISDIEPEEVGDQICHKYPFNYCDYFSELRYVNPNDERGKEFYLGKLKDPYYPYNYLPERKVDLLMFFSKFIDHGVIEAGVWGATNDDLLSLDLFDESHQVTLKAKFESRPICDTLSCGGDVRVETKTYEFRYDKNTREFYIKEDK